MIKTDIYICDTEYRAKITDYEKKIKDVCSTAIAHEGIPAALNISFVGCDDILALNANFRNVKSVTDVLSFPANELESPISKNGITCDMETEDGMVVLGDIAICVPRAEEQAEEFGHSLERELCFLAVHGTLHLLGYDHISVEDEKEMFDKQEQILHSLGIDR